MNIVFRVLKILGILVVGSFRLIILPCIGAYYSPCAFRPSWEASTFHRADQEAILNRFNELQLAFEAHDYQKSYTYASPNYRKTHSSDDFEKDFAIWVEAGIRDDALLFNRSAKCGEFLLGFTDFGLVQVDGVWYFDSVDWSTD